MTQNRKKYKKIQDNISGSSIERFKRNFNKI